MIGRVIILAVFAALTTVPAVAGSDVPVPTIAKAIDGPCVRDPKIMRTDHMNLLVHTRDLTVHDGLRSKKDSLQACLTCHAVAGDEGLAVGADDPRHFCRVCHDYAAVRVDCFDCHNAKPAAQGGTNE